MARALEVVLEGGSENEETRLCAQKRPRGGNTGAMVFPTGPEPCMHNQINTTLEYPPTAATTEPGSLRRGPAEGPVGSTAPLLVRVLKAVGGCGLSSSEKTLVRAMLQWWNPKTGQLWPSVGSLAEATGFSARGVQKILRRLEAAGVLERVVASKGGSTADRRGLTNRFLLRLEALPEREGAAPRTEGVGHPEPRSHKPTIQELPRGRDHSAERARGDVFVRAEKKCMGAPESPATPRVDPTSVLGALIVAGVRGTMLRALAASPMLTPELIAREARDVARDRRARNIPAILVSRLAEIAGVDVPKRPELDAKQMDVVAKIEQLRRLRGGMGGVR